MKTFVLAAGALVVGSGIAFGQTVIELQPEVRTEFHEYVVKEKVAPVIVEEDVRVGATLPGTVTLSPLPQFIVEAHPDYKTYRYVVIQDHIHIVDPETREVVSVID